MILAQIADGLLFGALCTLLALSLSLAFNLGGLLNMTQGVMYALGAFLFSAWSARLGIAGAMLISAVGVALCGLLIKGISVMAHETILTSKGRALHGVLLTTGLAYLVDQGMRNFAAPASGALGTGLTVWTPVALLVVVGGSWAFLHRTNWGLILRAGTRDPEMLQTLGINPRPLFTIMFCAAAGLAAWIGALCTILPGTAPGAVYEVLAVAFTVALIGGLGSFWGIVLAGMLVGVTRAAAMPFSPALAEAVPYLLLMGALLWRAQGLLGGRLNRFE